MADVCRQMGVSEASIYVWKKKYGRPGLTDIREIRQLRDESARRKRLQADLALVKHILGQFIAKEIGSPLGIACLRAGSKSAFRWRRCEHAGLARFSRAGFYRKSTARDQAAFRLRIREIAHSRPLFGEQRIHVMLRREGWPVNKKWVRRLYRIDGMQLRTRTRRRKHMCLHRGPVPVPSAPHEQWSMDFVHDQLSMAVRFAS